MVREAGGVPGAEQDRPRLHQGADAAPRTPSTAARCRRHHYFRDFAYCDSGMIPWLLVLELMAAPQQPLSALVAARMAAYPASGEINRTLPTPPRPVARRRGPLARPSDRRGPHRRPLAGPRHLAVQSAHVQHRAGAAPQRGDPADPALMQAKTDELLAVMT